MRRSTGGWQDTQISCADAPLGSADRQRASMPESFIIRSLLMNDLRLFQLAAKHTSHKTVFLLFWSETLFSARLFELSHNEMPSTVGVCTEKLNPRVVMVKSAQDGVRTYETGSLNRPRSRRIFV
jgi:hypothetical protein